MTRADFARLVSIALLGLTWGNPPVLAEEADDVVMYAVTLVGGPYRLGGNDPETGLDCSGLVNHVFRTTRGVVLPRDTRAMSEAMTPVPREELRPGDLVFFNTLNRGFSHVGIYLGDRRFVHATSSRTGRVMVSGLEEPYWRARFDGARRLDPAPARPD